MAKKIDPNKIIGLIFGDYIIIYYLGTFHNSIKVLTKCNVCGRVVERWYKDIKKGIGNTHKHCVILLPKDEIYKKLRQVHSDLKDRCSNTNNYRYQKWYKDGNIGYSEKFENFIDFYDYAKPILLQAVIDTKLPLNKLSIDRIDNNKGYFEGNIRFTTQKNQILNSRKILGRTIILINQDTDEKIVFKDKPSSEVAQYLNISKSCVQGAINRGKYKNYKIIVEKINPRQKICND